MASELQGKTIAILAADGVEQVELESTSGSTGTGKPAPTWSTTTMPRHCPTLSRKPATT